MSPIKTVDLDKNGNVLGPRGVVPFRELSRYLAQTLTIPPKTTDIFVFVHGWQNTRSGALSGAEKVLEMVAEGYRSSGDQYPRLEGFRPVFFAIRWKSRSLVLGSGYRFIRDRAHALTTRGYAAHILASLLGYLHDQRSAPKTPPTMQNRTGHYLHCVGHSLGGRVLGEAIKAAANPSQPPTFGWRWPRRHPFTVDSFTTFQMAAPPDIFSRDFASLLTMAPIRGPIVLTYSERDRAAGKFHEAAEKVKGIGTVGASSGGKLSLKRVDESYIHDDFPEKLMSVNATWCYRGRGIPGAHSGYIQPESAHLLLSLADLSRNCSADSVRRGGLIV